MTRNIERTHFELEVEGASELPWLELLTKVLMCERLELLFSSILCRHEASRPCKRLWLVFAYRRLGAQDLSWINKEKISLNSNKRAKSSLRYSPESVNNVTERSSLIFNITESLFCWMHLLSFDFHYLGVLKEEKLVRVGTTPSNSFVLVQGRSV